MARVGSGFMDELPVPDFYDPAHAEQWGYNPDHAVVLRRAAGWRDQHDIPPSSRDEKVIHLLLVDLQRDFCFPEGTLYVGGRSGRGAMEDNDRTARFIYRNLRNINEITCTLDTHFPHQIFLPAFWLDEAGGHPAPHQEVTLEDLRGGRLRPNPAMADWLAEGDYDWLQRQVEFYCEELARKGRYRLYLWPPHCILGSDGYALAGVIQEARMFHAYARGAEAWIEVKGSTPLTEYYSVLGPEVDETFEGEPLAERNLDFVETVLDADAVVIAGQAASHCVKATIDDLLTEIDPALASRVYILRDCMSSVAVPDPDRPGEFVFDFTPEAEAALNRFSDAGMHVVESTTAMAEWPDLF